MLHRRRVQFASRARNKQRLSLDSCTRPAWSCGLITVVLPGCISLHAWRQQIDAPLAKHSYWVEGSQRKTRYGAIESKRLHFSLDVFERPGQRPSASAINNAGFPQVFELCLACSFDLSSNAIGWSESEPCRIAEQLPSYERNFYVKFIRNMAYPLNKVCAGFYNSAVSSLNLIA